MATIHFDTKSFQDAVASGKPVLADFFATWCGPCKMMAPIVDEVAQQYEGRALVGKIDVDACMELAEEFKISTVPTFAFFNKGALVKIFSGLCSVADLEEILDTLCEK